MERLGSSTPRQSGWNARPIRAINAQGDTLWEFWGITEAKQLGFDPKSIYRVLDVPDKQYRGMFWIRV